MANFDFVVDDSFVGQVVGPPDGFVVSLITTTPQPKYETPFGDNGVWKAGYLQLRGTGDVRDLYCYCPGSSGMNDKTLIVNNSIPYRGGGLKVVCVPKGAVYALTLSDTPVVRAPSL